jgi:hypothetical protein
LVSRQGLGSCPTSATGANAGVPFAEPHFRKPPDRRGVAGRRLEVAHDPGITGVAALVGEVARPAGDACGNSPGGVGRGRSRPSGHRGAERKGAGAALYLEPGETFGQVAWRTGHPHGCARVPRRGRSSPLPAARMERTICRIRVSPPYEHRDSGRQVTHLGFSHEPRDRLAEIDSEPSTLGRIASRSSRPSEVAPPNASRSRQSSAFARYSTCASLRS